MPRSTAWWGHHVHVEWEIFDVPGQQINAGEEFTVKFHVVVRDTPIKDLQDVLFSDIKVVVSSTSRAEPVSGRTETIDFGTIKVGGRKSQNMRIKANDDIRHDKDLRILWVRLKATYENPFEIVGDVDAVY